MGVFYKCTIIVVWDDTTYVNTRGIQPLQSIALGNWVLDIFGHHDPLVALGHVNGTKNTIGSLGIGSKQTLKMITLYGLNPTCIWLSANTHHCGCP